MLQVWYNNDSTMDAYTVRIGDDLYGMSANPMHPQGFNQFACKVSDADMSRLGEQITSWHGLPWGVQKAIIDRLGMEW